MNVDRNAQALIDLVEADRARQCEAILADARARADAVRRQAHADARARMREAFAEERARLGAAVTSAQAQLQTHRRLHEQRRAAGLLELAARRLPEALAARWGDDRGRAAWVGRVVSAARSALGDCAWTVVHAPGWPAAEREALADGLCAGASGRPHFVEDASLGAGLKVLASGNVVDGSVAGLLADRDAIGARLLHLLEGGR
jgi:hypothetical protein